MAGGKRISEDLAWAVVRMHDDFPLKKVADYARTERDMVIAKW